MLKFISVCTVTNGVLLTDANRGQRVEYRCVMQDFDTGRIHRVVDCAGIYVGTIDNNGTIYAYFENGYIGDRFQAEMGSPLSFFTPESKGIIVDELMRQQDFIF